MKKSSKMKIIGYSERGIINSLIFSIGKNIALMNKFIQLINIPELNQLKKPKDYTILLEQSFSRFGDADLIIIVHYDNPKHNRVLFIEGKVKTYQVKKWRLNSQFNKLNKIDKLNKREKYNGYSSNLFFQLHLKKLLIDKWAEIKKYGGVKEPIFKDFRKIGDNKIVLKAFDLIACEKAYYVGLVPSTEKDINEFISENNTGFNFLSWEKVEKFCKQNELMEVLDMFKYNSGQIYQRPKEKLDNCNE